MSRETDRPESREPVNHVLRPSVPWRDTAALTECGRPVNDVAGAMTRDVFVARVSKLGKTRAAMTTCMTCWHTATRHPTWEQDPAGAMRREVGYGAPSDPRIQDELRALGLLVAAHRQEFAELLAGLGETASLSDARRKRAGRARGHGGVA